jgi:hypothetical protein
MLALHLDEIRWRNDLDALGTDQTGKLARACSVVQFEAGFCPKRQGERSFHSRIALSVHAEVLSA